MVPMGVGEDKVILIAFFLEQMVAEPSNSGSGIDDNNIITFGMDLQTGRVAAVFQIFFSGDRDRSPRPPAGNMHRYPFN